MVRITQIVAVATLFVGLSGAQNTGHLSCNALIDAGLGDSLLLPTGPGDAYSKSLASYFSKTVSEQTPWCILQAKNTEEVAKAVKALEPLSAAGQWNIAVRGAGHSHWLSNNTPNGVTIDMTLLNGIKVHNSTCAPNDTSIASIGTGARWGDVLLEVEKFGLGVTAGRVGTVGVGGLLLGGGASFHSGVRGFSCDDVVNYEVVLADGSIVNANKNQHADLFKALKGGSGNFGIVTRFDMVAFPAPALYGGNVFSSWDQKDKYVNSFLKVINNAEKRPQDSQITLFMWSPGMPDPMVGGVTVSADGVEDSESFEELQGIPTLFDLRKKQTYGQMAIESNDSGGQRYVWFSLSFHSDKRMMTKAEELLRGLMDEVSQVNSNDNAISVLFVFQPLLKLFAQANAGGNVLGLDKSLKEDSIIWIGQASAATPFMNAWFQVKMGAVSDELEAYAKSISANTPWRYLNYVNAAQDPLSSYGAENVEFMREVAASYDPSGFFQTRVSGGFKLSNVL